MQIIGNPTILAVCLALSCLSVSVRAETYDVRVEGTQILTPPAGPAPAINCPEVYGVSPVYFGVMLFAALLLAVGAADFHAMFNIPRRRKLQDVNSFFC